MRYECSTVFITHDNFSRIDYNRLPVVNYYPDKVVAYHGLNGPPYCFRMILEGELAERFKMRLSQVIASRNNPLERWEYYECQNEFGEVDYKKVNRLIVNRSTPEEVESIRGLLW
jgi:hypothetical protein